MQNSETIENINGFISNWHEKKVVHGSVQKSVNVNAKILARKRALCTLQVLESEMLEQAVCCDVPLDALKEGWTARNLFATLGRDGYRVFVWSLQSNFFHCREDLNLAKHEVICMLESAYDFSWRVLPLWDKRCDGCIEFLNDNRIVVQRVVAESFFIG